MTITHPNDFKHLLLLFLTFHLQYFYSHRLQLPRISVYLPASFSFDPQNMLLCRSVRRESARIFLKFYFLRAQTNNNLTKNENMYPSKVSFIQRGKSHSMKRTITPKNNARLNWTLERKFRNKYY